MHWKIGFDWFHMHSFIVSSQIAIRCRQINALDPIRFDVTIESSLFNMCWNCVVTQLLFTLERFVTQIARRLNFSVDIMIVVIEIGFNWKKAYHKCCRQILSKFFWNMWRFCSYCIAWMSQTDLNIMDEFGFETQENCWKIGYQNPPHFAILFWPKIGRVRGPEENMEFRCYSLKDTDHVEPGLYQPRCSRPASQATLRRACLMLQNIQIISWHNTLTSLIQSLSGSFGRQELLQAKGPWSGELGKCPGLRGGAACSRPKSLCLGPPDTLGCSCI